MAGDTDEEKAKGEGRNELIRKTLLQSAKKATSLFSGNDHGLMVCLDQPSG